MDLIIFFIGLILIFVLFPLTIIITIVKLVKKKNAKVWGIAIPVSLSVGVFLIIVSLFIPSEDSQNEIVENSNNKNETVSIEEKTDSNLADYDINIEKDNVEEVIYTQDQESVQEENAKTESMEQENEENKIESIFYGEIGLNKSYYMGKNITTSIKCDYINEDIKEISNDSNLCYGSIKVVLLEMENISEGEYITVSGVLCEEYGATTLKDSKILCRGNEAEENYNNELNTFKEEFVNSESVSYEDLVRYPDTYYNKKIKLEVDITDVESDGAIFNGTITGVIPGTDSEIAIYDYRENREPRIKENDKLTIYGIGNKTITVKLKNGKGLFAETVDEYEIPCIYLQFIDFR